ncbi:MAG: FxLYD domain-containing protein [Rhizobiaceae bacterium]
MARVYKWLGFIGVAIASIIIIVTWLAFDGIETTSNIDVQIERTFFRQPKPGAIVKVTNQGSEKVEQVFIDCTFSDAAGHTADIVWAMVADLEPGESKSAEVAVHKAGKLEGVSCVVDRVR